MTGDAGPGIFWNLAPGIRTAGAGFQRPGVVMSKPNTRRVIPRAARFAIASGGISLLLSFPAQQARAATGGQPPLLSGLTGDLGSIVSTVTGSVTGTATAVASAAVPANQVTPTASGSPPSQPAAPSGGQASPAVTATPSGPAATSSVASSAGAATPTAPGTPQSPVTAKAAATPATARQRGFRRDSAHPRCHASSADPGYRDGGTRSEQGGQSPAPVTTERPWSRRRRRRDRRRRRPIAPPPTS